MYFEPLKIELTLSTPIVMPYRKQAHPLHFDALIIALMTEGQKPDVPVTGTKWDEDPYAPGTGIVPLKVYQGASPVYYASVGFAENIIWRETSIIKKPPEPHLWQHIIATSKEKITFKINGDSTGVYRAWSETADIAVIQKLNFECVGDGEIIDELLHKNLRRIGFLRRLGFGNISNVSVTGSDNDHAGLITQAGYPARNLPVVDWQGQTDWLKINAAVRAPYWYPGNKEVCWSPMSDYPIPCF